MEDSNMWKPTSFVTRHGDTTAEILKEFNVVIKGLCEIADSLVGTDATEEMKSLITTILGDDMDDACFDMAFKLSYVRSILFGEAIHWDLGEQLLCERHRQLKQEQ